MELDICINKISKAYHNGTPIPVHSELDSGGQNVVVSIDGGEYKPNRYHVGTYSVDDVFPDRDTEESLNYQEGRVFVSQAEMKEILAYVNKAAAYHAEYVNDDLNDDEIVGFIEHGSAKLDELAMRWLVYAIPYQLKGVYEYGNIPFIARAWVTMFPERYEAVVARFAKVQHQQQTAFYHSQLDMVWTSAEVQRAYGLTATTTLRWCQDGTFKSAVKNQYGAVGYKLYRPEVEKVMEAKGYKRVDQSSVSVPIDGNEDKNEVL